MKAIDWAKAQVEIARIIHDDTWVYSYGCCNGGTELEDVDYAASQVVQYVRGLIADAAA